MLTLSPADSYIVFSNCIAIWHHLAISGCGLGCSIRNCVTLSEHQTDFAPIQCNLQLPYMYITLLDGQADSPALRRSSLVADRVHYAGLKLHHLLTLLGLLSLRLWLLLLRHLLLHLLQQQWVHRGTPKIELVSRHGLECSGEQTKPATSSFLASGQSSELSAPAIEPYR